MIMKSAYKDTRDMEITRTLCNLSFGLGGGLLEVPLVRCVKCQENLQLVVIVLHIITTILMSSIMTKLN